MTLILSLETSAQMCSVALTDNGNVIAEVSEELSHGQSAVLMDFIGRVFEKSGCKAQQLTHVAVNRGPGSFTGIRLGLAAAYGFSVAGKLPILGLSSFQIHRYLAGQGAMLIALDTRRDDFYGCFYGEKDVQPQWTKIMTVQDIKGEKVQLITDKLISGTQGEFHEKVQQLTAKNGGLAAWHFLQQGKIDVFSKEPFYLRPAAVYEK
ncbi:MAG: tRNA (adenosine(37)-N6)-threonylcarbamoyltransferase complex dimerization subunit type 1 TsaB [Alphaproteobacteria bacterium]